MAEVLVSAVVTVLVDKLYSAALMNFAQSEGIDSQLKKWKKTLPMIQAVLADAAQKQITQRPVELWLHELQDLAYDIEDVLDDMATEVMQRMLEESNASTNTSSKVLKMIPTCCTNYTPHNIMYGRNIRSKLDEITTRLNDLFEQKNNYGLNVNCETSNKTNKPLEETSLPEVSEILGREGDKAALLEKLLGDEVACNQDVSIVSIVGMGGIGKTTLARLLYNDDKVKDHFEPKAWVCVSDDFDVFNISKRIYQAVGGEDKQFTTLELLHLALKEKLSNKKFLLVLDDVWNEDHKKWEVFIRPLVGAPGSRIIVTTRNITVSSVMNSVQPHNLGVLSDELALSLFAQYALEEQNFDKYPSLSLIAQGIVNKCGGLPLALVTIGRVLKTKGNDDVEWGELLNSEIWRSQNGSDILPALKLSYYHLPSHLKQLFAYCSLYPKDHEFDKNKLVLKWMAQGFLSQTRGDKSMEILGHGYFEELRLRCFFQPSTNDKSRYTMHDLMNDLAISVAGEFFFMLDDKADRNGQNEAFEKFRYFSFVGERDAEYRKFKELHRARCLRTFLPVSVGRKRFKRLDNVLVNLLARLQFLRVLSLTENLISKVPQSIGNLKHLRYLNFSSTSIKHLPEQVGKLYNLQSLLVRDCHKLCSLPVSFEKLKNLRHLDMTDTPSLKKLPLGIGGLRNLQTLSKVIIEGGNGFKVSELKDLKDLQGGLSIEGLEKVIDPTEAKDANLEQKKGLDDLELEWSDVSQELRDSTNEEDVLERLRPPSKLKKLRIKGYGGMKFPSWLRNPTSYDQLTKLTLRDCKNCTELPSLGHLTSLRKLYVYGCSKLVSINKGEKEVVNMGSSIIMGSLRQVKINSCGALESYCCPNSVEELDIRNCSSMTSLSFSKLQEGPPSSSSSSSNLKALSISFCMNIKSVSQEHLQSLTSLRQVSLIDCGALESYCCPNSVERLEISGCDSMTSLSFSKLQKGPPSSSSSSNLKVLLISDCKNIKSISQEHLQSLTSLEQMWIFRCPSMEDSFPSSSGLLWPPNLKWLTIGELKKPMSDWGLQNYPSSLVHLDLYGKNSGVDSFGIMEEEEEDHVMRNNNTTPPPTMDRGF